MSAGINQIIKTLLDSQNPIYSSILIIAIILTVIFFIHRYWINPAYELLQKEKENLELKSARLMAQFAELDPDPVIRIDMFGKILETNQAAQLVFADNDLNNKKIDDLLPVLNIPKDTPIITETRTLFQKIGPRYYSILYRGDSDLQIAQLYFRDITESKDYEEKLINYQLRLKNLSERLHDLIERERRRIASGLHDGIGQSLSLLRIKMLKIKEATNDSVKIYNYQELIESLEIIINDLKDISYSLKPKTLEEMGLRIAIKNIIDKVRMETDICGELNMFSEDIRFDEKTEINIYRIVQEAINNLVKYSNATSYSIQLTNSSKFIRLIVTDNGIGFDPETVVQSKEKKGGMGLLNMMDRVESLNGSFKIESIPGNGTMLVAEIPIKEKSVWHSNNQYAS